MFVAVRVLHACSVVLVLLAGQACRQQKVQSKGAPPAVPVTVAKASSASVPLELRVVGTVEASAIVQVKAQIAGQLLTVHFTEGQNVQKGSLLFSIDPRPFQDALRQAEAAVVRDQAQIRQAEASLARDQAQAKNAETDAGRFAELAKAGVISKTQNDQARTQADVYRESARATQATIESMRAAVQSDLAAVDRAKLDLSYCEIRAPISGRTGNLLVHAGNLVKANDVPMVVIHQVAPIFASFAVPEEHLGAIRKLSANQRLGVKAFGQDNPQRGASGVVAVIDNTVDSATGTIKLKATFDNRDALLWPGQFVNVVLTLDTIRDATVIPSEAVQAGQQGQFVYVVKDNGTAESRVITVGRTFEGKVIVEKGVGPGDTVVTDGQLRLYPGAQVRVVEAGKAEAGKS